jgi:hypothetical protein
MAMVDYPYPSDFVTPMPANPVRVACGLIRNTTEGGHSHFDVLQSLNALINVFLNYTGALPCHDVMGEIVSDVTSPEAAVAAGGASSSSSTLSPSPSSSDDGGGHLPGFRGLGNITSAWNYQACTELPMEPVTNGGTGFCECQCKCECGSAASIGMLLYVPN